MKMEKNKQHFISLSGLSLVLSQQRTARAWMSNNNIFLKGDSCVLLTEKVNENGASDKLSTLVMHRESE